MKAVVAKRTGNADVLRLVDIDIPELQDNEVLINVRGFGLNKIETYYRKGEYGTFVPNQALGVEAVGVIAKDPSGTYLPGQKVAAAMGGMMFRRHGGYAEYVAVNLSNVIALNTSLSFLELAGLPEAYATVWGALDKTLRISKDQSLLIRGGTSSIGMAAIAYAKAKGLTVIATSRDSSKLNRLQDIGADIAILDNGNIHRSVKEIFPEGVHSALEIVGAPTLLDSMKSVRTFGGVAVVGLLGGPPVVENFNLMGDLPNSVKLSYFSSGILGSEALPMKDIPLDWVAQQMEQGAIPNTVSNVFNLDEIRDAHRLLESNQANGKIVVMI